MANDICEYHNPHEDEEPKAPEHRCINRDEVIHRLHYLQWLNRNVEEMNESIFYRRDSFEQWLEAL